MPAPFAKCPKCDQSAVFRSDSVWSTLLWYQTRDGHHHDDNCRSREYRCANGHRFAVSLRNKCSVEGCAWLGRETCFCHKGAKFDAWPEINDARAAE